MSGVTRVMHVPAFGGRASSCANYEEKVALRNQISTLEPQKRAADLPLHMTDVARRVCVAAWERCPWRREWDGDNFANLRERFAPGAIDSILQDLAKFLYSKRTAQNMDTY